MIERDTKVFLLVLCSLAVSLFVISSSPVFLLSFAGVQPAQYHGVSDSLSKEIDAGPNERVQRFSQHLRPLNRLFHSQSIETDEDVQTSTMYNFGSVHKENYDISFESVFIQTRANFPTVAKPKITNVETEGDDKCFGVKDEGECNKDTDCVWCKSSAIPSKCYPTSLSKRLPNGVFNCDKQTDKRTQKLDVTLNTMKTGDLTSEKDPKKLCDPNVGQAAGYFRLGEQDKHYFFWFFESRNNPTKDPVILWMTGGPGCSSELALFVENGPCSVNSDGTDTIINKYSWNNNASIIFIDQPAGTGFSYGTHDTNEYVIGEDMNLFLHEFFDKFPKYKFNKFFVFGESYAGHYVPATAYAIFKHNQKSKEHAFKIDLSGLGIGNGLTDPEVQYKYYPQMAYNSTTAPSRVSWEQYTLMNAAVTPCIAAIKACNNAGSGVTSEVVCDGAVDLCNAALIDPYEASGYNVYDMRIKCQVPGLCYDFSAVSKYLHREEVLDYLGVDESKRDWNSCDMGVHAALIGDWMKNYQDLIPPLLDANIKVLVYAGDQDYIVNWLGCRAWTLDMNWSGKEQFNKAPENEWFTAPGAKTAGKGDGKLRKFGNFMFLQVYQAGHMVPLDQPAVSLTMVNNFIFKGEL